MQSNMKGLRFLAYLGILTIFIIQPLTMKGQWNTNTAQNLNISGMEAGPMESASTSDDKVWVAFYSTNEGNFDMRAQLFDASGNKLLGPDGVLVSNQSSGTATFVYGVCVDASDNFIIAMQYEIADDYQIVLYKISQQGEHLWTSAGVKPGTGLAPYPALLSTGEIVVSWLSTTSNTLDYQKISPSGTLVWENPYSITIGTSKTTRGQIVGNLDGKFTIVYQKKGYGVATTLYAQHFNNDGTALYDPMQICDQTSSGARYYSILAEADTTYFGYYSSAGYRFDSFLQRINPDGTTPWGMNGSNFNTSTGSNDNYQGLTQICREAGSDYIWSVCSFCDPNQTVYGIYVQKFSKVSGARILGDQAKEVFPISATRNIPAGNLIVEDDNPIFMYSDVNEKMYVTRLDATGSFIWPNQAAEICSTTNGKSRYNFNRVDEHWLAGMWVENRGSFDMGYIQGITTGGLIGMDVATQGAVPAEINTYGGTLQLQAIVYPSTAGQNVEWSIIPETGNAIIDASGLVTAAVNGTVWAKAISQQDTYIQDSLLITITGQVPVAPTIQNVGSENIGFYEATLFAGVNANNNTTEVNFEWGLTSSYGNTTATVPPTINGIQFVEISALIDNLDAGTTYHFRCVATNNVGTTNSPDFTFTTNCLMEDEIGEITGNENVCINTGDYEYSVPAVQNATIYNWTLPEGMTITGGEQTNSITVQVSEEAQSGDIGVYASDGTCYTEESGPFHVTVNEIPDAPSIIASGIVLSSDMEEGNQWYLNGEAIEGATAQQYTALANGTYYATVSDAYCTSVPSNNIIITNVSNQDLNVGKEIFVYPNPSHGLVEVKTIKRTENPVIIEVLNNYGSIVRSIELKGNEHSSIHTIIDLTSCPAGVYVIAIRENRFMETKRVVIIK